MAVTIAFAPSWTDCKTAENQGFSIFVLHQSSLESLDRAPKRFLAELANVFNGALAGFGAAMARNRGWRRPEDSHEQIFVQGHPGSRCVLGEVGDDSAGPIDLQITHGRWRRW